MTPAARVAAAIEILDAWIADTVPLDRLLAAWGRSHRFAGSGDRRAIADWVYDAVRCRRSAAWVAGVDAPADGRALIRGLAHLLGQPVEEVFDGSRFGPAMLSQDERFVRSLDTAPRAVRLDYPDWLDGWLDGISDATLTALRSRAPVDVRANLLRGTRDEAAAALRSEGIETQPVDLAPTALRVTAGTRRVAQSLAYTSGLVEIQDAASQAVADAVAPAAGERVLDLCAGGGGKALAIAALCPEACLFAYDIAPERMQDLPARAARAGASIRVLTAEDLAEAAPFDAVLVDAPCSGFGAWRRNPDAKWRLDARELARLVATQATLMDQAAGLLASNGRLIYATCSLLRAENAEQVAKFQNRHAHWDRLVERTLALQDGGDGFFFTCLQKNLSST